jgi:hypothetical protein
LLHACARAGILEANYSLVVIHVITAIYGQPFWQQRLPLPFALPPALEAFNSELRLLTYMWMVCSDAGLLLADHLATALEEMFLHDVRVLQHSCIAGI